MKSNITSNNKGITKQFYVNSISVEKIGTAIIRTKSKTLINQTKGDARDY